MTARQAGKLLDVLYEVAEEWENPAPYLEAIDMAQVVLRESVDKGLFDVLEVDDGDE